MWRRELCAVLKFRNALRGLTSTPVSFHNKNTYCSSFLLTKVEFVRKQPLEWIRKYSKVSSNVLPQNACEASELRPSHLEDSNYVKDDQKTQTGGILNKGEVRDKHKDNLKDDQLAGIGSTDCNVNLHVPSPTVVNDECEGLLIETKPVVSILESENTIELKDNSSQNYNSGESPVKNNDDGEQVDFDKNIKTKDQEQILLETVVSNKECTNEQWEELRNRVLHVGSKLNEQTIDATILGLCITHKSLKMAISFINYLQASSQELNVATTSKFFKLSFICSSEVNNEIEGLIISLYDSLRSRYPTLDASTAENVLHGLCVTKRWKDGLEILDEIRLTCTPNTLAYSALIKASFNNDDPDTGWDLLTKMMIDRRKPLSIVYEAWLQYCKRTAGGNSKQALRLIEKMLYFIANNDIRLSEEVASMLREYFEYETPPEEDWNVEFTSVDTRGLCKSCHQYLKRIEISAKEFATLRSVFIDTAIVGSNVFLKSTPEELTEFQNFIKKTAPYDVIIDGLNVAYVAKGPKGNQRQYAKMLQSVVQHFVENSHKVLVLGRRHMYNWPSDYMDYIHKNAALFLTQNLSQDDPYLLYAAMYSGLGTCFISRDLMRSHAFLLKDPQLHSCFVRWQKQHQYHVLSVGEGGQVRFRPPQKISTSAQRNKDGSWHVPYDLESDSSRNPNFNSPRQWLCLSPYANSRFSDGQEENYH